jgi:predicted nucleotidyltransferase
MGKKGVGIENIEQLSVVLRESDFDIYAAILFGSRARGDALEDSDWDLIIGKGHYIAYQKGSIHRLLLFVKLGSLHRVPF